MCSVSDTSVRCICSKDEKGVEPIVSKVARITLVALGVIACVAGAMVMLELSIPLFPTFQASTGLAFLGGGVLAGVLGITLRIMQPSSPLKSSVDEKLAPIPAEEVLDEESGNVDDSTLDAWVDTAAEGENRVKAKARMELSELNLGGLKLIELPPGIDQLQQLTRLDLDHNCFEAFPDQLLALRNLTRLTISGNPQIAELPDTIQQLTGLECLYIADTGIKELPHTFSNLKKLRVLSIRGVDFGENPPKILLDCTGLQSIYISRSSIATNIAQPDYKAFVGELLENNVEVIYSPYEGTNQSLRNGMEVPDSFS